MQPLPLRFGRGCRLVDANDFRLVFKQSQRSVDRFFTVLWRPNAMNRGRLGLAIAKKHMQRAVSRNRVKRVVRESFRLHQQTLIGVDVVVLSRKGITHEDSARLTKSLERHWRRVTESLTDH